MFSRVNSWIVRVLRAEPRDPASFEKLAVKVFPKRSLGCSIISRTLTFQIPRRLSKNEVNFVGRKYRKAFTVNTISSLMLLTCFTNGNSFGTSFRADTQTHCHSCGIG